MKNNQETDLNKVKEMAIAFLHLTPTVDETFPFFVMHPFFENRISVLPNKNNNKVFQTFDIFKEPEKYNTLLEHVGHRIRACKNVCSIFFMFRKSYRLVFFKYTKQYLSEKDFAEMLKFCWATCESPMNDANVTKKEIVCWFTNANKRFLMNKEEKKIRKSLPQMVEIFRGTRSAAYELGISWTLSREKAEWFAKRFSDYNNEFHVYSYWIDKKDILCYINERNEQEVIVDYNKLKKFRVQELKL